MKLNSFLYKFLVYTLMFIVILIFTDKIEQLVYGKTLSIKDFTKGDGITNDTFGIKKALKYAKEKGYKRIYIPSGKYLIDATQMNDPIVIYDGLSLFGDGFTSEFRINPKSFNNSGRYNVFVTESNTTISNININGQKSLVNRNKLSNCDLVGIIGKKPNQHNYHFKNIWIHDLIGIHKESFGLMTSLGSSNVSFKNIVGYDVEGTPIHVAGDYLNNNLTSNVVVQECTTFDNTWQGISVYGARDVEINNHQAYRNSGNGLNFEWCWNVDVFNSKSFNNGRAGFGSYGKANFNLYKCLSKENNTTNQNWIGEIALTPSSWYTGSPPPKGTVGVVVVNKCNIEPTRGKKHLVYGADNTVNVGTALPDGLTIINSNVEDWVISSRDYNGLINNNSFIPNIFFKGLDKLEPIKLEKLSDFTVTSNINIQLYKGKGNLNPDAITLTGINKKYSNIFSEYIFKPNKQYHVKIRYKALSTNRWIVISRDSTQTAPPYSIILNGDSSIVGQWKTSEGIFKTDSREQRIQIQYDGNIFPDSIAIDYIDIKEIVYSSKR